MANINLEQYGIIGSTVIAHNPSYEELYQAEINPALTGYEKGQVTELGAVNVMTGVFTGRSKEVLISAFFSDFFLKIIYVS